MRSRSSLYWIHGEERGIYLLRDALDSGFRSE